MKLITTLCLFFIVSGLCVGQIRVCADCPYTNLTTAIAAASENQTITVDGGIYREGNLIIDKPIKLLGINSPVLDGENKFEILTIKAANVSVSGFHFRNSGVSSLEELAGIRTQATSNILIENNTFERCFFGIYISGSKNIRIVNNRLKTDEKFEQYNGNGIHAWKCENIHIENNTIEGHRDGIYFEFVTQSMIINNFSSKNLRYGLHFMFSHQNEYHRNTFRNNGAGVAVMYTEKIVMKHNIFEENIGGAAYGLLLKDIRDSHIEGNQFRKNSAGVYMEGSSRCLFINNTFSGNGWAVRLQASCDDNVFERNNFTGNSFDLATNGHTVLNTFNKNYWDKYEGYDLDKNGFGDIPYRPLSLYSIMVEKVPAAMMLYRSMLVQLMDKMERVIPSMTPENFIDLNPSMHAYPIHIPTF
jgi:nitrous oxidase accessory protein